MWGSKCFRMCVCVCGGGGLKSCEKDIFFLSLLIHFPHESSQQLSEAFSNIRVLIGKGPDIW